MIKILFHVSLFWWMQLYTHLCTYSYSYTIVTNVRGQYSSIVFFYNYGSTAVQWMICSLIYSCIKSEFWLVEWDEKNQECFTHSWGLGMGHVTCVAGSWFCCVHHCWLCHPPEDKGRDSQLTMATSGVWETLSNRAFTRCMNHQGIVQDNK